MEGLKNKIKKRERSFTLVETLVYITVLMLIVTAVILLLAWLINSAVKSKVMRETLDNAKRSMEIMVYEIKEARNIYNPTSSSSQLSLQTIKYLPDGEESSFVDFYLCGTQLCLKKESKSPIVITSEAVKVENLTFTKVGSDSFPSFQIDITVSYKNPCGKPEYNALTRLISSASLRSY